MPSSIRRFGILLPLLLILAACAAGPSERPPIPYRDTNSSAAPAPHPTGPAPVPPLGPAARQLDWHDCALGATGPSDAPAAPELRFRCTEFSSLLDAPNAPDQGRVRVAVLAAGQGQIPLVVVNDAGGQPGTSFTADLAKKLPPRILDTFTLIGVDRRGSGFSDPANCIPRQQRADIVGFDPFATSRPKLDNLAEAIRASSQECLLDLDERLTAYDTWRTTTDLEQLRHLLGVPKLHAIGRGEAARVLTTYAERYPGNVGRMIIDGAPDPTLDAIAANETRARAAEQAFDAFAAACGAGCPLGPDPRGAVRELLERTRGEGLPSGGTTPVTAGRIVHAIMLGLSDQQRWPELVSALDSANRGDGSAIAAITEPLLFGERGGNPPRLDADLVTTCNDTTVRVPPQRITDISADWAHRYPMFGGVFAQQLVWCGQWPVPQQPLPTPRQPGLPPIPVIATETDPLTPSSGSAAMAEQLPSGILLRWQGSGHGALGRSSCVNETVSQFLVRGQPPQNGMVCPP